MLLLAYTKAYTYHWASDANGSWATQASWVGAAQQVHAVIDFNNSSADLTNNFTTTSTVTRDTWDSAAGVASKGGVLVSTDTVGSNENYNTPLALASNETVVIECLFKTNAVTGTSSNQVVGVGIVTALSEECGATAGNSLFVSLRQGTSATADLSLATASVDSAVLTNTLRGNTFVPRTNYWYKLVARITKTATSNTFQIVGTLYECGSDGLQNNGVHRVFSGASVTNAGVYGASNVYVGFYNRQTSGSPIQIHAIDSFRASKLVTWSTPLPPNSSATEVVLGRAPGAASLAGRTVTLNQNATLKSLTLAGYTSSLTITPSSTEKLVFQTTDDTYPSLLCLGGANATISVPIELKTTTIFGSWASSTRTFSEVISGSGDLIFKVTNGVLDFTNAANTGTGQIIVRAAASTVGPAFNNISSFNSTVLLGDALSNPTDFKTITLGAGTYSNNFDATQAPGAPSGQTVGRPQIRAKTGAIVTLSGNITWGNTVSATSNIRLDLGCTSGTLILTGKLSTTTYAGSLTYSGSASGSGTYIPRNQTNDYAVSTVLARGNLHLEYSVPKYGASILGTVSNITLGDGSALTSDACAVHLTYTNLTMAKSVTLGGTTQGTPGALQQYSLGTSIGGTPVNGTGTWSGTITTLSSAYTFPLTLYACDNSTCTFSGTISKHASATALKLNKTGTGIVVLSNTCNFQTTFTVSAGELVISGTTTVDAAATNTVADNSTLTVADTGTLILG